MNFRKNMAFEIAWHLLGTPYRWGGDDPILGFDCSGFIVEILKSVGVLLKSPLEPRDLAARYGGEEFSIILVDKGKADAQRLAEVIRKKIEGEKFILRQVETHVTISIGCATLPPGHSGVSRDDLIKSADTALYEAKKSGGNRACLA